MELLHMTGRRDSSSSRRGERRAPQQDAGYSDRMQDTIMESIVIESSDDDIDMVADQSNSRKRAKCGRTPSDVWNEIVPVNPAPNGDHTTCKCKHCHKVFNHPIKQRAHRGDRKER